MSGHATEAGQQENGAPSAATDVRATAEGPPVSAASEALSADATSARPSSLPAPTAQRFGSSAPLAPPRPGPSTAPPRRPTSAPPNGRAGTPPPGTALKSTPPAPLAPSGASVPVPAAPPVAVALPSPEELVVAELREHLDSAERALAARAIEVRALLLQRDARISEVTALKRELESAKADHAREIAELVGRLEEARARVLPSDDLQLIRGIGPAFARELARLGVRTFAQIAGWSDADIERIAPQIKARADRIRRDDWPKSAALLIRERSATGNARDHD